jgi:hypothetical protein
LILTHIIVIEYIFSFYDKEWSPHVRNNGVIAFSMSISDQGNKNESHFNHFLVSIFEGKIDVRNNGVIGFFVYISEQKQLNFLTWG